MPKPKGEIEVLKTKNAKTTWPKMPKPDGEIEVLETKNAKTTW